MDMTINGHNVKVSEAIEEFIQKKVGRLDRYMPNIQDIRIDLAVQRSNRGADLAIAQITLRHTRGAILRAEEKVSIDDRDAIKVAINRAVDKMYSRISRFKGKQQPKRGRDRFLATLDELQLAEELPAPETDLPEEAAPDMEGIVRRKDIPVSPMNDEEAIQQMELLGHAFFVFVNAETNSLNILYKRASGGYGILVPQLA